MMERKDIGARLEAWARWARLSGDRGNDCMTGVICESMRRAALGNVWSGHDTADAIDDADAIRIERGMSILPVKPRLLLWWCYIRNAPPEVVCRKLSIPVRPSSVFVEQFRAAQDEIEGIVGNLK